MKSPLLRLCSVRPTVSLVSFAVFALAVGAPAIQAVEVDAFLDGQPVTLELTEVPQIPFTIEDGRTVDIVGDTSNMSTGTGRAKGNSYEVLTTVTLTEAEFYLQFSDTQMLTFYVFTCPTEFGTYTEVYRDMALVPGAGPGWYSSGEIAVEMTAGEHYIIAVSWDGTLSYFYGTGDYQGTSFGGYTHGYATGYDPLPASFESQTNDQAIYHQRLTTGAPTPPDHSTWGAVKSLFR